MPRLLRNTHPCQSMETIVGEGGLTNTHTAPLGEPEVTHV